MSEHRMDRAREEYAAIHDHTATDKPTTASLTFLAWHVDNLIKNATAGRYRLALMRDDQEVEPLELKYDNEVRSHLEAGQ